jgi:hypothetical protein
VIPLRRDNDLDIGENEVAQSLASSGNRHKPYARVNAGIEVLVRDDIPRKDAMNDSNEAKR